MNYFFDDAKKLVLSLFHAFFVRIQSYAYGLLKICDFVCIGWSGVYGVRLLAMEKLISLCVTGRKAAMKVHQVQRWQKVLWCLECGST